MNKKRIFIIALIVILIILAVSAAVILREQGERRGEAVGEPIQSQPLSSEKEAIKNRLVAPLSGAGVLTENERFRIEYYAPDFFQGVIKTADFKSASREVVDWLKDQGFSEDDICRLPLTFSLTPEIEKEFRESGASYTVLPDFCQ